MQDQTKAELSSTLEQAVDPAARAAEDDIMNCGSGAAELVRTRAYRGSKVAGVLHGSVFGSRGRVSLLDAGEQRNPVLLKPPARRYHRRPCGVISSFSWPSSAVLRRAVFPQNPPLAPRSLPPRLLRALPPS